MHNHAQHRINLAFQIMIFFTMSALSRCAFTRAGKQSTIQDHISAPEYPLLRIDSRFWSWLVKSMSETAFCEQAHWSLPRSSLFSTMRRIKRLSIGTESTKCTTWRLVSFQDNRIRMRHIEASSWCDDVLRAENAASATRLKDGIPLRIKLRSMPGSNMAWTYSREACKRRPLCLRKRSIDLSLAHASIVSIMRCVLRVAWSVRRVYYRASVRPNERLVRQKWSFVK